MAKKEETRVKVLIFGELLSEIPIDSENKAKAVFEKVYSENDVVNVIERKGELYFVVKR